MMLAGFLFLFLLTGRSKSTTEQQDQQTTTEDTDSVGEKNCSYHDVINHLKLFKNNSMFTVTRPVKNVTYPTIVNITLILFAILDVREESFIPHVWISLEWMNDHIKWDPDDFGGIKRIIVPTELLWKPDIIIDEITEKEKTPPSPYLIIESDGTVKYMSNQMLISTCGMSLYNFPFDTQRCTLSFRSIVHSDEEIYLGVNPNSVTALSHAKMGNHSEWRLCSITLRTETTYHFGFEQSMIVYTISMRRKPVLYIVSFILPVVFFLLLDFASFLISDTGGEKLSFKITVLLAITLMQLILNEILPSSLDGIPLIAVYCIGIFMMMMLSLVETIVVMYLLQKDPEQCNKDDQDQSLSEDGTDRQSESRVRNKWPFCVCDADEPPTQALPDNEGSSNMTEVSRSLEKASDDLRKVEKTISLFSNGSKKEGRKLNYWIRVTKRINKVFFVCYVTAAVVFLIVIFKQWLPDDDEGLHFTSVW